MNDRIQQLLAQMTVLEDELREALHQQETSMLFEIRGNVSNSNTPSGRRIAV
jgi:hypothetical protein